MEQKIPLRKQSDDVVREILDTGVLGNISLFIFNNENNTFMQLSASQINQIKNVHPKKTALPLQHGGVDRHNQVYFGYNQSTNYEDLWIERNELVKFLDSDKNSSSTSSQLHESKKASLYKMVLGMAAKKYNYNPNRTRNTATGGNNRSIRADAESIGLSIDEDTIRTILEEASAEFSDVKYPT